jgi:hydrogenase nickel insertion protein HypA
MHEVSLVHDLFDQTDTAIRPHAPAAVREVTVRIGTMAGVDGVLFRTAFDGCKGERGYDAASLTIVVEEAEWGCERCGTRLSPEAGPLRCAACEGPARLRAGDALILQRLELEVSPV